MGIELTRNIQSRLHLPGRQMCRGRLRVSHVILCQNLQGLTLKILYTCFTIWTTDTGIGVGSGSRLCRPTSLGNIRFRVVWCSRSHRLRDQPPPSQISHRTYDVKVLEEPPSPLCSSLNSLITQEWMNVCHEEIDPSSELSRHDGSSVRCTNWQFLVEAPCGLSLSNIGYSGKDRSD